MLQYEEENERRKEMSNQTKLPKLLERDTNLTRTSPPYKISSQVTEKLESKEIIEVLDLFVKYGLLTKTKKGYVNSNLIKPFFKFNLQDRVSKIVSKVEKEARRNILKEVNNIVDDLYHKVGDVWSISNDVVCDLCEEYIKKKLKELERGGD